MTVLAAASAAPLIDWTALGKVAGVSLVFGVAVVVLFSLGIVGLSMARGDEAPADTPRRTVGWPGRSWPGSASCCCAAAVLYGLYLIVPQFH